jgi:hypothetical protein
LAVQEQSLKHRLISNSALALIPLILMGCGGGGAGSAQNIVPTPPPVVAPFVELKFAYEAHRFATTDVVPAYTYAGVTYPAGLANIFPQGSISIDFEGDRYPEVVIPLNKAYGTPTYAALFGVSTFETVWGFRLEEGFGLIAVT